MSSKIRLLGPAERETLNGIKQLLRPSPDRNSLNVINIMFDSIGRHPRSRFKFSSADVATVRL